VFAESGAGKAPRHAQRAFATLTEGRPMRDPGSFVARRITRTLSVLSADCLRPRSRRLDPQRVTVALRRDGVAAT
jgi:hypothetical protein